MTAIDCDVVVIGAGVSGLAVTAALTDHGLDVVCLDARDRIGGRLHTIGSEQGPLDLGASWFWPGEERVQRLVAESGIAFHAQHIAGDALYDAEGGPRRLDGNPIDVAAYRYTRGAQSVTDALASGLPPGSVRTRSPVSSVSVDAGGARVVAAGCELAARQVVVAAPPALVAETVAFQPALPPEVQGLARLTPIWMGSTVKVVAVYRDPFWRDAGLSGAVFSEVGPLREIHDLSGPEGDDPAALFGFGSSAPNASGPAAPHVFGPSAPNASGLRAEQVVDQLVRLFGPSAAAPTEVVVADWSRERWTSPPGVSPSGAFQLFGHPLYQGPTLQGRVHWASTETAAGYPGHVEGALEAAERTASAVLREFGQSPPPGTRAAQTGKAG
ncbi:MAG TPA: FAD-dependent oxidoreductase [Acidimicrobiales bacterium]|nr:FAD-dependent oxidoreductase [Acidimicrobiales bacterium]